MTHPKEPLALDPGSPMVPALFRQYLLFGLLARGGMAEVYRGMHRETGEKIALKCVRADLIQPDLLNMFQEEAQLACSLRHENIVRAFPGGSFGQNAFFTMEYISGQDLRRLFWRLAARGELLPVPLTIYIVSQVLKALDYLHERRSAQGALLNLVNRDVSPSNIRLSYRGEVKLLDFGIALRPQTRSPARKGTPPGKIDYMAPEQAEGKPLDKRADLYSVGVVLYELLTGKRLFSGEEHKVLLQRVPAPQVSPPSAVRSHGVLGLDATVLRSLAPDPTHRFPTALSFAQALSSLHLPVRGRGALGRYLRKLFAEEFQREVVVQELMGSVKMEQHDPPQDPPQEGDTLELTWGEETGSDVANT